MVLDILFKRWLFFVLFFSFFSCKKAEDRICFKTIGEASQVAHPIQSTSFELHDALRYVFFQDSINQIVVKGGKNLIKHIELTHLMDTIVIKSKNKCNFLRKLSTEITVEIHLTTLKNLSIYSSDSVINRGVLTGNNLHLIMFDGASTVRLHLNMDTIQTYVRDGFSNIFYSGNAKFCNANISNATSLDILGLTVSQSIYINSITSRNIFVNAEQTSLTGEINSNGNVYYRGTPAYFHYTKNKGKGDFIKIE